jgi:hypothetical protein
MVKKEPDYNYDSEKKDWDKTLADYERKLMIDSFSSYLPVRGNYFRISAKIGDNSYSVDIKTKDDAEIVLGLLNKYAKLLDTQ